MKRKFKLLVLMMVTLVMTLLTFSSVVFADGAINVVSSVPKSQMVIKAIDEQIKVDKVDGVYISVEPYGAQESTSGSSGMAEEQKGSKTKVFGWVGMFCRVNDGFIQIDIMSTSSTARLIGNSQKNIKVEVYYTDGGKSIITGTVKGVFDESSETPSTDDSENSEYLFKDFKYTHSDTSNGGHWAYDQVKDMKEVDIVRGTTAGYLFPDSPVALEEFIAFLARTLEHMDIAKDTSTSNIYNIHMVEGNYNKWVQGDFCTLLNAYAIINGETTNKGKKELDKILTADENMRSTVTRQEAAVMMAAFLGDCETTENPNQFKDWDKVRDDFKGRVSRLCEYGVMFGSTNLDGNYINPTEEITRVQAIVMLSKFMEVKKELMLKPYSETIEKPTASDTTDPVITFVTPDGSGLKPKSKINVNVKDNESNITTVRYSWDNAVSTNEYLINKKTYSLELTVPEKEGKHTLRVWARNAGGQSTGWKLVTYTVDKDAKDADTTPPKVSFYVGGKETNNGINVIVDSKETTGTIKAEDPESKVVEIKYWWDSDSETVVNSDTVVINLPENKDVIHYLYIEAKNSIGLVGQGIFTYKQNGVDYNKDNTPPVVTINTTLNKISNKDVIKINAKDPESGVAIIQYRWDSEDTKYIICNNSFDVTIVAQETPQTEGNHTLYVVAKNSEGDQSNEQKYVFEIIQSSDRLIPDSTGSLEDDTTPPIVTIDTVNTNLTTENKVQVTAYDDESGIIQIVYRWDSESDKIRTWETCTMIKATFEIECPKTIGKHTLYIKALNGNKIWGQEVNKEYNIAAASGEYEDDPIINDKTSPIVTINTTKTRISTKDVIKVTVKDNESGVSKVEYSWDNDTNSVIVDCKGAAEVVLPVSVPQTESEHILYIKAQDIKGNISEKKYTFDIEKTNKPVIEDDTKIDYENDKTPPVVSIDTTQEKLSTKDKVSITAYDNESGITQLVYRWDSNKEVVIPCDGNILKLTTKISVPQTADTHYLYVKAVNGANNRIWSQEILKVFKIVVSDKPLNEGEIDSPIKVIVDGDEDDTIFNDGKTANLVKPETILIITGEKPENVVKIGYRWDNNEEEIVDENEFKVEVPEDVGTHYLYVRLKNKDGEWTPERKYKFVVVKNLDKVELETVKIEIKDDEDSTLVMSKEYDWEDIDDNKITIKAPTKEGSYVMYVRVFDEDDNIFEVIKQKFDIEDEDKSNLVTKAKLPKSKLTVELTKDGKESSDAGMVTYPGNPELIGAINPNVTTLRVEMRNADEKLMFEPKEEIKYYVDFYNGNSADIEDVEIKFILPEDFEAISASDDGIVSKENVVWELGTVKAGGGNRYTVTIKYVKEITEELHFVPEVAIYVDKKLTDSSFVYNVIYKSGNSSMGSHTRYVVGYPDGTFKPSGTITRAEMAAMCANLFGINTYGGSSFYDIQSNHWASSAVNGCVSAGLIDAYGEFFDPDSAATRATFAIALARQLGVANIEPIFINSNDTENHYARKEMEQLIRLGLVEGYPDGSAGPNNLVTRAEAVTMLNKYAFRGGLTLSSYGNYGSSYVFSDLSTGHWALEHILEAALNHTYVRTENGAEKSY